MSTTVGLPKLELKGVTKRFGDHVAVDAVDLEVADGEILALLGPSGCGKTTTLRLVAGFEAPDTGTITIAGRTVQGDGVNVPPDKRRVGVVFQDYALFPHLDVAGNIGFGLGRRGARSDRVGEMLALVGLTGLGHRKPRELSGGQQQRVALARALAPDPDLVMLDEPFSNLDAALRQRVRADVERILRAAGATAVFVTHAQDEALSVADRVAVMRAGEIVQEAGPVDLYKRPASTFVAEFIADATLVAGRRVEGGVECGFGVLRVDGVGELASDELVIAVRPEAVRLRADDSAGYRIVDSEYYGHDEVVTVEALGDPSIMLRARLDASELLQPGTIVTVAIGLERADVFSAQR